MKKKQLFAVLLAGSMTVGMAPAAAFAAEDTGAVTEAEASTADENTETPDDGAAVDDQSQSEADAQAEAEAQAAAQAEAEAQAAAQAQAEAEAQAAAQAQAEAEAQAAEAAAQSVASGQEVIDYACQFIGNPYVWGGTSLTDGADCSGFVQSVYAHFGISLPRTSYEQRSAGYEVSYEDAQPGDLILYEGHVGLYIGNDQIVNAMNEDQGIGISSATYTNIVAVRRIY